MWRTGIPEIIAVMFWMIFPAVGWIASGTTPASIGVRLDAIYPALARDCLWQNKFSPIEKPSRLSYMRHQASPRSNAGLRPRWQPPARSPHCGGRKGKPRLPGAGCRHVLYNSQSISRRRGFDRSANASECRECRVPNNNCVQDRMICRVGTQKRVSLACFILSFIMFLSVHRARWKRLKKTHRVCEPVS